MIEKATNKMVGGGSLSARDSFIIEKSEKGFTPTEILVLMKKEGIAPVARSRVYQILNREKVKSKD